MATRVMTGGRARRGWAALAGMGSIASPVPGVHQGMRVSHCSHPSTRRRARLHGLLESFGRWIVAPLDRGLPDSIASKTAVPLVASLSALCSLSVSLPLSVRYASSLSWTRLTVVVGDANAASLVPSTPSSPLLSSLPPAAASGLRLLHSARSRTNVASTFATFSLNGGSHAVVANLGLSWSTTLFSSPSPHRMPS